MSRIVVDTDVASYIFNWHSLAQQYAAALRGSELILSFMTIAELRMGADSRRCASGGPGTRSPGRLDRGDSIGARRPARNKQPARF